MVFEIVYKGPGDLILRFRYFFLQIANEVFHRKQFYTSMFFFKVKGFRTIWGNAKGHKSANDSLVLKFKTVSLISGMLNDNLVDLTLAMHVYKCRPLFKQLNSCHFTLL